MIVAEILTDVTAAERYIPRCWFWDPLLWLDSPCSYEQWTVLARNTSSLSCAL